VVDAEGRVELPLPDRVADQQRAQAADHRGADLLDGGVQDVAAPDHAHVDDDQAHHHQEHGDRAQRVDERGQDRVGRCLSWELMHVRS
jgi:hypothetical protein